MGNDSRISIGLPNLANGVSQQAPNLRLTSQGQTQQNLYSSLVQGLVKRPPTTHVAKLMDGTGGEADMLAHFIDRGDSERYTVLFGDSTVNIYSIADGTEYPVYAPSGLTYLSVTNTAREDIRAVSLADYTMVTNKQQVVAMDTTETLVPEPVATAYVWVKRGNYSTSYVINVAGTNYSITTAAPTTTSPTFVATETIATSLVAALGPLGALGYTVTQVGGSGTTGSLIKIVKNDGASFTFGVSDSFSSAALVGLKVNISSREDLPDVGEDGMWFRITGASKDADDDYYVRYNDNSGAYKGIWEEYRGWNQYNSFDATTMPHRLVRYFVTGTEAGALATWISGEGLLVGEIYFLFDVAEWEDRTVGDETTAEQPSFVGRTISDVFFHSTRLGVLSGEWFFLSRISQFFDFWPSTVQQTLDDGPITASTGQITGLHSAVPWNNALLTFSERSQFQLTSNGALTPSSAKADEATTFDASADSHPVASGPNVYFSSDREPFSVVREYFISDDGVSNDAANITGHVPEFIPAGIFDMSASSNEDTLLLLTTGQRDTIYNYKYYWAGRDKLQSSWSEFVLEGATLIGINFFRENVYIVTLRDGDVYLEYFPLQAFAVDTGLTYLVHLDRKCTVTGSYNSGTDVTTFTLPYEEDVNTNLTVVLGEDFTTNKGAPIETGLRPTSSSLTLSGDVSAGPVFIGKTYESRYTFSPFYVRTGDDTNSALLTGVFQVQELVVDYSDSGDFFVETSVDGRDDSIERQSGILGSPAYKIGEVFVESGTGKYGVQASSDTFEISLVNDSPFPSQWLNAEVIGTYDSLQRRI
jgi:hypothetical protein